MRRIGIGLAVVVLALGYWMWPYLGAYDLAQAAQRRDAAELTARIDQPALKRSLTRQIVTAYLEKSGRADKMGAFQRGLANAVGASVASPYLDDLLSPDTLAALLAQGHVGTLKVGDRTVAVDKTIPALPALFQSHLIDVLSHSFFDGVTSFRFGLPAVDGGEPYGVHLKLAGLVWRLSGLDLPPTILDKIVEDAIAAERKATGGSAG